MDLKQELRKLAQLQKIDTKIYSLKQKKDEEAPLKIEELKAKFEEQKKVIASFEEKLKQLQLKRKEKELDLASREENLRKAQAQLYALKTNKEYQAKLTEIESHKADVSVIEEDILKVFEEIDSVEKELEAQKSKFSEEGKKNKEQENSILKEVSLLEKEIQQLQDKKRITKDTINSQTLSVYSRLIKACGGVGIAGVESENCCACHIKVTAQTINEIKMYKNLIFCENCIRILFIKEDIE